jgi:hypothetical protein
MAVDFLQGAVPAEEFGGGLLTDAADAGDVIRFIADQRFIIPKLGRGEAAVAGADGFFVVESAIGEAAAGQEDLHARRDQLQEVLVPGDDDRLQALLSGLPGQGAQKVIGLQAGNLHDGDAEGLDNLTDAVHLDAHLVGHAVPVGLVVGVNLVAAGVARVKADGDVVGFQFLEDVEEGGGEAVGGIGRFAVAGGEAFQRQGVEGPVGQGVTVYENQAHGMTHLRTSV